MAAGNKPPPKRQNPIDLKPDGLYCVDALDGLRKLPDNSIDCVMTSPPYWAMRDYGLPPVRWPDGNTSPLGLETDPTRYLEHLCSLFAEVRRVLKPTGTVWVNLGDGYYNGRRCAHAAPSPQTICNGNNRDFYRGPKACPGTPKKCLMQIPARFAIKMVEAGWILRNDVVWHKRNHLPSSVKDRLTPSCEHLFFFVREPRYYFDLDAIRVPHQTLKPPRKANARPADRSSPHPKGNRWPPNPGEPGAFHPLGKNPGDCWAIATRSYPGAHFAVYPEQFCERPIQAGCPAKVCRRCGTPDLTPSSREKVAGEPQNTRKGPSFGCRCKKGYIPGLVLDPFVGSGTTAVVAKRLGRRFIGFDANPDYIRLAKKRLSSA